MDRAGPGHLGQEEPHRGDLGTLPGRLPEATPCGQVSVAAPLLHDSEHGGVSWKDTAALGAASTGNERKKSRSYCQNLSSSPGHRGVLRPEGPCFPCHRHLLSSQSPWGASPRGVWGVFLCPRGEPFSGICWSPLGQRSPWTVALCLLAQRNCALGLALERVVTACRCCAPQGAATGQGTAPIISDSSRNLKGAQLCILFPEAPWRVAGTSVSRCSRSSGSPSGCPVVQVHSGGDIVEVSKGVSPAGKGQRDCVRASEPLVLANQRGSV